MQEYVLCKRDLNNYTFVFSCTHKNRHFYALICRCFLQLFPWLQKAKVFAPCVPFVTCSMFLFCSKVTAVQQGTERFSFLVSFETRPCRSLIYKLTSLTAHSAPAASQRICRTEKTHLCMFFLPWGHWQNPSAFQMSLCWKSFLRI